MDGIFGGLGEVGEEALREREHGGACGLEAVAGDVEESGGGAGGADLGGDELAGGEGGGERGGEVDDGDGAEGGGGAGGNEALLEVVFSFESCGT